MSTMGALESFGGLTWVRGSSDVIGSVVPVVLPGDAAAGFGVGCSTACSDGVHQSEWWERLGLFSISFCGGVHVS